MSFRKKKFLVEFPNKVQRLTILAFICKIWCFILMFTLSLRLRVSLYLFAIVSEIESITLHICHCFWDWEYYFTFFCHCVWDWEYHFTFLPLFLRLRILLYIFAIVSETECITLPFCHLFNVISRTWIIWKLKKFNKI